jgi:hypothetical protein
MSGYVMAHSYCFGCGRLFSYNPRRVPSVRPQPDMPPEPICQACVDEVNPIRMAKGLPPIIPYTDAYDPLPEAEL